MSSRDGGARRPRGQILALFALSLVVIVLAVSLVIDGGNALLQRRSSQNGSDMAALAGARIIATWIDGDSVNGTDGNVVSAINATVAANGGSPVTYGSPAGPRYVSRAGAFTGWVGSGTIPTGTEGVTVGTSRTFRPYLLGIIGSGDWTASSVATARGGYAAAPPSGNVFPAGVSLAFFETYPFCTGPVGSSPDCQPIHLTPGNLNVPGGFGWLKFGATGQCAGFGLGMSTTSGCEENRPFLQDEIGPPANSHGCCTAVSGNPDLDRIGSVPGNKVSADCSYYIDNEIVVTVPIWDYAGGSGANGWYHIIGFAGFQLTACEGGKNISGVWRKQFFLGPTTGSSPGEFASLAVQLVR
jgi:Putative Flp pilus-assembly TadE/G-like